MTPIERLSLAIHLESAAIAPQTSELIEAGKEVLRENERMQMAILWALGEHPDDLGCWFGDVVEDQKNGRDRPYWWRRPLRRMSGIDQQLIPEKDGGLLSAAMTVLSECQDGPPSEQSIDSLRDAVDAAIR